ncbi:MAG TPA: hypothetical protein V6C76_10550 [Drouetiella sp.]
MFDYQAGEKQKLTLIMVGFAGLMAGMFFTMLLMPQPDPRHAAKGPPPKWKMDPDANGSRMGGGMGGGGRYAPKDGDAAAQAAAVAQFQGGGAGQQQAQQPAGELCDPNLALNLVNPWLEYVWDLNAATAQASQEKAIQYMTADCANAYRQNIWTPDMARQVQESGLQSSFRTQKVSAGQNQPDGSVVIFVEGDQVLKMAGKPDSTRHVKMEYLVKKLPEGIRIAGISEGSGS